MRGPVPGRTPIALVLGLIATLAPSGCLDPITTSRDPRGGASALNGPADEPAGLTLPLNGAELAMERVAGLPFVQARLNGHAPRWFLIDTGSAVTVLSSDLADELDLPRRTMHANVVGGGGSQFVATSAIAIDRLEIGGAAFHGVEAMAWGLDGLSEIVGRDVAGILGFPLFVDCLLTLDYPNHRVRIEAGELDPVNDITVLSCVAPGGTPAIVVTCGEHDAIFLIDSGASEGVTVSEDLATQLRWADGPHASHVIQTISGIAAARRGRLRHDLRFGAYRVDAPPAAVGSHDLLGAGLLELFVVTFDQRRAAVQFVQADF